MDGASKFVRGDAIAGLLLTAINIVGGLAIGIFQAGMPLTQAADVFTRLTIGDGLVTQVPALLISLAAGVLVTRSSAPTNVSGDMVRQTLAQPRTLLLTAGFLGLMVFTSLPAVPLLLLAAASVALAVFVQRSPEATSAPTGKRPQPTPCAPPANESGALDDLLRVDPLVLELGLGLIRLADRKRGGDIMTRISEVRRGVAAELGIVLPKLRMHDNMRLGRNEYRVKLNGLVIASGEVEPSRLLALDWGTAHESLEGIAVNDPAFGLSGVWIDPKIHDRAEQAGYQVIDSAGVIATHLTELIRRHAGELLTREATATLIESLRGCAPTLVAELVPTVVSIGQIQRVLQLLLDEGVPVRHLVPILEAIGDAATSGERLTPEHLAEAARRRMARTLCHRYRDEEHRLWVVALEGDNESQLSAFLSGQPTGETASLPEALEFLLRRIDHETERLAAGGHPRVVLVAASARRGLRQLLQRRCSDVVVLSPAEVTSDTRIEIVARIGQRQGAAA